MNAFIWRNPSDEMMILGVNVLLQVTVIALVALAVALPFRRNAALKYWVLCSALMLCLLSPVIALLMQSSGVGLLSLSLLESSIDEPAATRTADAPVLMPTTEPGTQWSEPAFSAPAANERVNPSLNAPMPTVSRDQTWEVSGAMPTDVESSPQPIAHLVLRVAMPFVLVLWFAGTMVLLIRLLRGWRMLARILGAAQPVAAESLDDVIAETCGKLGLGRRPRILSSPDVAGPIAAGIWNPRVVLPLKMLDHVDALEIRDVLMHELAHIRRRDQFVALLQSIAAALIWIHPLIHVLNRCLAGAREEVCDNHVLATTDAPSYSRTLLHLAEMVQRNQPLPGTVSLLTSRWKLETRVAGLLDERRNLVTRLNKGGTVLVLLLSSVLCVGAGLVNFVPDTRANDRNQQQVPEIDDEVAVVNGVVVDPDGKPIKGARISVIIEESYEGPDKPLSETVSAENGLFQLRFTKSAAVHYTRDGWKYSSLLAAADGFGPAWILTKDSVGQELTLQLVQDGNPIEGRILTAEGQPVRGATLTVRKLWSTQSGNLGRFLDGAKAGQQEFPELGVRVAGPVVNTDAQGRFKLTGLGPERVVTMEVEGEGIATSQLHVVTRDMSPLGDGELMFYGAKFDYVAEPSRPIVGRVFDIDTQEPLVGVVVQSERIRGRSDFEVRGLIKTMTDQEGRFQLTGMPNSRRSEILVVPTTQQPYFPLRRQVLNTQGFEKAVVDVGLKRGIWITGRVTDQTDGKPVSSRVHYFAFLSNEHAKDYANFQPGGAVTDRMQNRFRTNADGTFRIVGIPGRGLVAAVCSGEPYCTGNGADRIEGLNEQGAFNTYSNPSPCSAKYYHSIVEVNPKAQEEAEWVELHLDPGRSLSIQVVDADDQPVTGFTAVGLVTPGIPETVTSDTAQVLAVDPRYGRFLQLRNDEKNLGRIVRIDGKTPSRLKVRLEPCASISGRILDTEGQPVSGVRLGLGLVDVGDFAPRFSPVFSDADGQYRFDNVLSGWNYFVVGETKSQTSFYVSKLVSIQPGKSIDLGEKVARSEPDNVLTAAD